MLRQSERDRADLVIFLSGYDTLVSPPSYLYADHETERRAAGVPLFVSADPGDTFENLTYETLTSIDGRADPGEEAIENFVGSHFLSRTNLEQRRQVGRDAPETTPEPLFVVNTNHRYGNGGGCEGGEEGPRTPQLSQAAAHTLFREHHAAALR